MYLTVLSCANRGSPTGGPKDTIPPNLVRSYPENRTVNFSEKEIVLEFDEFIRINNITQNLLINPAIEEFEYDVKKRTLTIIIQDTLEDNTTYTFNFSGVVSDITENNKAENILLALSTGSYIDSLEVNGIVMVNSTHQPASKSYVGLYPFDSVRLDTIKPLYFAVTDEYGAYNIPYVKQGRYFLYTFTDENNNLKIDPKTEAYGFLIDGIDIDTIVSSDLYIYNEDLTELRLNSARTNGNYFEMKYNKTLDTFFVLNNTDSLLYSLYDDNKTIRFFRKPGTTFDSLMSITLARDIAEYEKRDTVFVQFTESRRPPIDFTARITPKSTSKVYLSDSFQVVFTKPILSIDTASIFIAYDSVDQQIVTDIKANYNQTMLTFRFDIDPEKIKDTTQSDSNRLLSGLVSKYRPFTIELDSSAFVSVENDTLPPASLRYSIIDPTNRGIIRGNFMCDSSQHFIIQLLNNSFEVKHELLDVATYVFKDVEPGEYYLRIILDDNNNGRYDDGDLYKLKEPEKIIFYSDKINLKANFEITNNDILYFPVDNRVENVKNGPWIK